MPRGMASIERSPRRSSSRRCAHRSGWLCISIIVNSSGAKLWTSTSRSLRRSTCRANGSQWTQRKRHFSCRNSKFGCVHCIAFELAREHMHGCTLSQKYRCDPRAQTFGRICARPQMLPTVIVFKDGVVADQFSGFDEMGAKDDFRTEVMEHWFSKVGCVKIKATDAKKAMQGSSDEEESDEED